MIIARARTFVNILREGITRTRIDRSEKIVKDGKKNDFPQYLTEIVFASPTATACLSRRHAFIQGKGFQGEIEQVKVNEDDTFAQFHEKISSDLNLFGRFAIRIIPNRAGKIAELHHVPAEWVRWSEPDETGEIKTVYINPFILTEDERRYKGVKHYPIFNGLDNLRRESTEFGTEYRGHVLFFNLTNQRNRNYSRPDYFSAEDYIRVDSKIGQFHDRNTDNNFFLGGILSVVGDPSAGLKDPTSGEIYTTLGEEFEKRMADAFSGTGNAGNIMLDWVTDIEHASKLEPWTGDNNHEKFKLTYDQSREVISIATGIPLIILGLPTAGKLGESNEMRNIIDFVNERTEKFRRKVEHVYNMLIEGIDGFPEDEVKIEPIQDSGDLPDNIFAALSANQRAEYLERRFNIEPDEVEEPNLTEFQISENGSNN